MLRVVVTNPQYALAANLATIFPPPRILCVLSFSSRHSTWALKT